MICELTLFNGENRNGISDLPRLTMTKAANFIRYLIANPSAWLPTLVEMRIKTRSQYEFNFENLQNLGRRS